MSSETITKVMKNFKIITTISPIKYVNFFQLAQTESH